MPKYKKTDKKITEGFIDAVFGAIGKAIRPAVIKNLSRKDPKFAELVKDMEATRAKLDKHIKNNTKLDKADKAAIKRGDLPDWLK